MRTLLIALAVGVAAARSAAAQSVCLAADSLGAPLLNQIRHVASSADAKMVTYRLYMKIPQTPAGRFSS